MALIGLRLNQDPKKFAASRRIQSNPYPISSDVYLSQILGGGRPPKRETQENLAPALCRDCLFGWTKNVPLGCGPPESRFRAEFAGVSEAQGITNTLRPPAGPRCHSKQSRHKITLEDPLPEAIEGRGRKASRPGPSGNRLTDGLWWWANFGSIQQRWWSWQYLVPTYQ